MTETLAPQTTENSKTQQLKSSQINVAYRGATQIRWSQETLAKSWPV